MYDYNSLDYVTDYSSLTSGADSAFAGMSASSIVISIAVSVFMIICYWKIFVKAGEEGWKSIIPIYDIIVEFKIVGLNPWLILLFLIPIVNLAMAIILNIKLAQAFGKTGWFAVGLIFIPYIFFPILAFSDAEYKGV